MEEWCCENENECETEKVHCEEKYSRNEKQWWAWRVYKSETETTKQFEWNKNTVEYSNDERKTEAEGV